MASDLTTPLTPHLRKIRGSSQLMVKGKPFLMLPVELHNSTFSSAAYMERVWPEMKAIHANTILAPVTWEMIEPTEGTFDFSELDKCVLGARKHGLHLVLLWFGAYKNTLSSYAPIWVKTDIDRFPRIHIKNKEGTLKTLEAVQPHCKEAWKADARAFANLMRHIKRLDEDHSTILMVQVQNEIGVMGDSRDRSRIADELIQKPVPADLWAYLQTNKSTLHAEFRKRFSDALGNPATSPTWIEAFGPGPFADDLFMADAFSRYIQAVTAAGRAEYDIPYYVNVALCSEDPSWLDVESIPDEVPAGDVPGQYPSGGPVGHNLDIYQHNAPDIAFWAPDIYLQDYELVCECYRHNDRPLFIPEQRRDEYGARRIWVAYGNYQALGCSPFGIDTLDPETSPTKKHFKLLRSIKDYILDAHANRPDDIMGFFFDEDAEMTSKSKTQWVKSFGDFLVTVKRASVFGIPSSAAGIIIRQPNGRFLIAGFGVQINFASTDPDSTLTSVHSVKEMEVDESGALRCARVLNGDETIHGSCVIMPSEDPDYGGFPIPSSIPGRTMIAECVPYSIKEAQSHF
ncbi:uncharacterized protein NECHADRAFT_106625 [Fusarium vanettenii 77-13-4]|uniref:Glycoside hydrolase family 35 n=1 Tax=Fusarium vanettenii (strain ATCC MYA-4622 / CBS 123669 / FGSC 9596 / NRRL 45880 / 77-13-4) TaxID=660122 RepID=C7ZRE7_FUSV7|nr:uncharacterized protein NECHADRAFT_106625 [Fusarium vanettenii 77-13-4]EEU33412.1 hypothetical protein NECHADRAFT_106625 [Fusarium vanettenii 77-13-4]